MPIRPSQGGSDAPAEVPDGDWPVLSAPPADFVEISVNHRINFVKPPSVTGRSAMGFFYPITITKHHNRCHLLVRLGGRQGVLLELVRPCDHIHVFVQQRATTRGIEPAMHD